MLWLAVVLVVVGSLGVALNKDAGRDDRLTAVGSMFVLAAVLAGCGAVLALIAASV